MEKWSDIQYRFVAFVGFVIFVLFTYFVSSHLTIFEPYQAKRTSIDNAIPLWPWTITIYLSHCFLVMALFVTTPRPRQFHYLFAGYMGLTLLSLIFFVTVPFEIRFDPIEVTGFWSWSMDIMRYWDVDVNMLPSLHVLMAVYGPLYIYWVQGSSRKNWIFLIWGGAITISTLTTKQHYLADILTAVPIAVLLAYPTAKWVALADKLDGDTSESSWPPGDTSPIS